MPSLMKVPASDGSNPAPFEAGQPRPGCGVTGDAVTQLRQFYTIAGSDHLISETLVDVPALFSLLSDAVEPLRIAFGEQKFLKLEALESPDEGNLLRVTVPVPTRDPESSAASMRGFKRSWWLKRCADARARLVFDYETGDGL